MADRVLDDLIAVQGAILALADAPFEAKAVRARLAKLTLPQLAMLAAFTCIEGSAIHASLVRGLVSHFSPPVGKAGE